MGFLIIGFIVLVVSFFAFRMKVGTDEKWIHWCAYTGFSVSAFFVVYAFLLTVPAGHVKVATMFGKVQDETYREGLHFVNPLFDFTEFDLRQKTHKETAGIPAEDKLITNMDVSVQYRTIGDMAPDILRNTGSTDALIEVHMIPKLRSILREQGKGVAISQDFFKESIQRQLQQTLQVGLSEYLSSKGIAVETVLIRNVILPSVIREAITETKKREQEVLKQKAELERFATEQDQKVKQAESEYEAAKLEAKKIKELADAEAYKIEAINKTLAKSPNYIELKKVEQWNGVLPVYAGGENVPMIDLRK
jgi:regulator of protease activity HflC (stomatin/prohibitin superfamily)